MWNVSRAKLHSFLFHSFVLSYNGQLGYKLFEVKLHTISTFDRVILFILSRKKKYSKLNKFVVKYLKKEKITDKHNDSIHFLLFIWTCFFRWYISKFRRCKALSRKGTFVSPLWSLYAFAINNCVLLASHHPNCYHFG